jgi:hypothetical protein
MMRRREFITLLGGAAAAWPLAARAQQAAKTSVPISEMNETGDHPYYPALFKELRRLGYVEGKNLVVARYSGEGREDRYPELCRDVVVTKPDVIVTSASRLVLSFKAATHTIPDSAQKSRPIDPVFRADSVVLAISAEKDGNLRVVCARIGRDKVVLLGEVLKAAVARPYPAVTCHVGVNGGPPCFRAPVGGHRYTSRDHAGGVVSLLRTSRGRGA